MVRYNKIHNVLSKKIQILIKKRQVKEPKWVINCYILFFSTRLTGSTFNFFYFICYGFFLIDMFKQFYI